MKQLLISWFRKIASDTHNVIVGIVVIALLTALSTYLLGWFNSVQQFLEQETPIWLSIALTLSGMLCCLIFIRNTNTHNEKKIRHSTKEKLIDAGQFKWKVQYDSGSVIRVNGVPYCKEHELQLVIDGGAWICPLKDCESRVSDRDLSKVRMYADSYIENIVMNMEKH